MNETDIPRSFNLTEQPWIPIAGVGEVSLTDVFRHPEYARLGGTPVEKVVIMRLLLCIAHACCELRDDADWHALTPQKLAENALAYLKKWKSRFDLFDEKYPFLQFPQLKGKCKASSMEAVSLPTASGNKTVLTQWHGRNMFTDAETVRLLLAGVSYGCGGKKYDNSVKISPQGPDKKPSGAQGPLTGYTGYLHAFLQGETILDTIQFNMLTEKEIQSLGSFSSLGHPFWESMPTDENGDTANDYRSGYLGVLFPLGKFMCLDNQNLLMTEGIPYPSHKNGQWDPGITIFLDKKDYKALWCDTERKPWRQLTSLMKFLESERRDDTMPAFVILGLSRLGSRGVSTFGVWTGGVALNTNSGEQYVSGKKDYVDSEFLIPMEWTKELSFLQFKDFMEIVDQYSRNLYGAVMNYYKSLKDERNDQIAAAATRLFWEMMEPLAQSIIELSTETDLEKIEAEKKKWREIGMACYEQFCPCISPRQIQVYVQNRPYFVDKKEKSSSKKGGKNE